MLFTYEEKTTKDNELVIVRSDGAFIPTDPANSDYKRYLRWLENPDADESGTL